jgi:hypothetical protein
LGKQTANNEILVARVGEKLTIPGEEDIYSRVDNMLLWIGSEEQTIKVMSSFPSLSGSTRQNASWQ